MSDIEQFTEIFIRILVFFTGCFAVVVPSWVYLKKQVLFPGALVLAFFGTILSSSGAWKRVLIDAQGFKAELTHLKRQHSEEIAQLKLAHFRQISQIEKSVENRSNGVETNLVQTRQASAPNLKDYKNWTAVGGTFYRIRKGDTLSVISRRYGVPIDVVRHFNNLESGRNDNTLQIGQRILLPRAKTNNSFMTMTAQGRKPPNSDRRATAAVSRQNSLASVPEITIDFIDPIDGKRDLRSETPENKLGTRYTAPPNTKVVAAAPGYIIFAGAVKDRGKAVAITHIGNITSIYRRLGKISVKVGDAVAAGDTIGFTGATSEESEIFFQVKKNNTPIDPSFKNKHPRNSYHQDRAQLPKNIPTLPIPKSYQN